MSAIGKNPYQPPESEQPAPSEPAQVAAQPHKAAAPQFAPNAGRRVTSTIICTGGIVWCLMSLAVFLETLLSGSDTPATDLRGELLVWVFFAAIGLSIFALGMFIRRDQKQRTLVMMLFILVLLVLFPFIAIATDDAANPWR